MDVTTIPELWGVGVVHTTIVQKWDPIQISIYILKKTWHTIGTIKL